MPFILCIVVKPSSTCVTVITEVPSVKLHVSIKDWFRGKFFATFSAYKRHFSFHNSGNGCLIWLCSLR